MNALCEILYGKDSYSIQQQLLVRQFRNLARSQYVNMFHLCQCCNYVSQVYWQQLRQPLAKRRREPLSPSGRDDVVDVVEPDLGSYAPTTKAAPGSHTPKPRRKIKVPDIFREKTAFEARSRVMCKS